MHAWDTLLYLPGARRKVCAPSNRLDKPDKKKEKGLGNGVPNEKRVLGKSLAV